MRRLLKHWSVDMTMIHIKTLKIVNVTDEFTKISRESLERWKISTKNGVLRTQNRLHELQPPEILFYLFTTNDLE